MPKFIAILYILCTLVVLPLEAHSADIKQAINAFQKGDYAQAFIEYEEFAKNGDAEGIAKFWK